MSGSDESSGRQRPAPNPGECGCAARRAGPLPKCPAEGPGKSLVADNACRPGRRSTRRGLGISRARVDDYLGPHRVSFASNFNGEVELDLGPIGNAYLTSPVRPIGLTITVGGVGTAAETVSSLFSEQTLTAYTGLYTEPGEAISGIVERLARTLCGRALRPRLSCCSGLDCRLRRYLVHRGSSRR